MLRSAARSPISSNRVCGPRASFPYSRLLKVQLVLLRTSLGEAPAYRAIISRGRKVEHVRLLTWSKRTSVRVCRLNGPLN